MLEQCELRVNASQAHLLFDPSEGKPCGELVRIIRLSTTDPRYAKVGALRDRLEREQGISFFYGWSMERTYSKLEIEEASFFHLSITTAFEPTGEECGTLYNMSAVCPMCGAGRKLISPLRLDASRIPKGKDIAITIGSEMIVSRRLADLIRETGLRGLDLQPVVVVKGKQPSSEWFHLTASSDGVDVVPPTRFGIDPFDDDEKGLYRCPQGHVSGLNLLSEVHVKTGAREINDLFFSRQLVGWRVGVLVPHPILFVSKRFVNLLNECGTKGYKLEAIRV